MQGTCERAFRTFIIATLLLIMPAVAVAREAIVTLKDGRQLTGEVASEDDNTVVLVISNIRTPIAREDIRDLEYKLTIEEQYRNRRAAVDDKDYEERYRIAYWLFDSKAYALAKREVEDMQRTFPDEDRPKLLGRAIEERMKLAQDAARADAAAAPVTPVRPVTPVQPTTTAAAAESDPVGPEARLNDEQVNLIRVFEVDFATNPRIIVPRDVVDEFLTKYADRDEVPKGRAAQQTFRAAPAATQLSAIFSARAREFYPRVTVREDPAFIRRFQTTIHRNYVLNYCGTINCHGGAQAGDYVVFRTDPNGARTVYSNFLTIYNYDSTAGFMVDLQSPERSLLLQYGLPREAAMQPHPQVDGWRHNLNSDRDPGYQLVLQWITSIPRPKQNYMVDWRPPRLPSRLRQQQQEQPAAPAQATPAAGNR